MEARSVNEGFFPSTETVDHQCKLVIWYLENWSTPIAGQATGHQIKTRGGVSGNHAHLSLHYFEIGCIDSYHIFIGKSFFEVNIGSR